MTDRAEPADDGRRPEPAAALLALGLGRTEAAASDDEEPDDAELERFLCALPDLELHGCLGRGGMGRVYRARQIRLDRFVAVKLMNAELGGDPEFRERFEREARALARLDHPGVVRVHDFGEAGGVFYLIMELVEGPSLRELIGEGMAPDEATRIVEQLCDALAYAHARGVVHRDIKPENVLIDRTGRVKVADFGLAKLQQVEPGATTRRVVGTPQYMAPEQLTDPGSVDHRADVFAIGVVFYEMLTGQLPVGRFPSPSELGRGDAVIDRVVLRALESSREKRFQAASEIREALDSRAIDDPQTMTQPGIEPPRSRTRSRTRVRMAAALGAGGLLAAGIGVAIVTNGSDPADVAAPSEPRVRTVVAVADDPAPAEEPAEEEPVPEKPVPGVRANRWPASDLALLSNDTAIVVGVDWADLRQAPALASLQGGFGDDPAWKQCYADVIARTHKMIVAFDAKGTPTEAVVHGAWAPEQLEACLRAAAGTGGEKKKVTVKRETLGELVRMTPTVGGKPSYAVVVGQAQARLWLSFREKLDVEHAKRLFESAEGSSDIGQRLGTKVDLGAPMWVLADAFPGEWEGKPVAAWGHLDLWEVLQIDATLSFDAEDKAERTKNMLEGYKAIFMNIEEGPKLQLEIVRDALQVSVKGSVPIPKDADSTFKLAPVEGESNVGFNLRFSD